MSEQESRPLLPFQIRKLGRPLNLWSLYKFVSGMNAVRLRKLLSTLEGEDYPADPRTAYAQIRQATLCGTLEVPHVDLASDIGGYTKVKERLSKEIIDVLALKDRLTQPEDVSRIEELIPKGMIFWGPPGTGKTLFAKAMAAAIGAAITIVSDQHAPIRDRITGELGRGVTVYRGYGGMSGVEQDILYCVVTRLEIGKVKAIVRGLDPAAFVVFHPLAGAEGGMVRPRGLH